MSFPIATQQLPRYPLHRPWEQGMLCLQYSGCEGLRSVLWLNRDLLLCEYGTGVILFVGQVDRCAAFALPCFDHSGVDVHPVHPFSTKLWQECRVDVENASSPLSHNTWRQLAHVPGQDDQIYPLLFKKRNQLSLVLFRCVGEHPWGESERGDVMLPRVLEHAWIPVVAHAESYPCRCLRQSVEMLYNSTEVRASSRGEGGDHDLSAFILHDGQTSAILEEEGRRTKKPLRDIPERLSLANHRLIRIRSRRDGLGRLADHRHLA